FSSAVAVHVFWSRVAQLRRWRTFTHIMQPTKHPLLLALAIAALPVHRSHADSLLGLWQTETNHWGAPGHTNKVEGVETIEFFKDHSFRIAEIAVLDGKRWTNISFTGTYVILGTNEVSLKLVPQNIAPTATPPSLTISCSVVGDELEIPKFI